MIGRSILSLAAVALGATSLPGIADAQQSPVPAGSVDVGTVGIPGSSVDGGDGTWSVSGSGSDIWGGWDHMHYLHFNRTSDVTVTCLVKSFTGSTAGWRKGGIMFREHIGPRSPHSMIQLTGYGIAHQSRQFENWHMINVNENYSTENVWLQLVKVGNTITSYMKRDGEYDFLQFNSVEVDLGDSFLVGLALTSHDNTKLATLDVRNFEISDDIYSLAAEPHEIGDTGETVWVQQYAPQMWSLQAGGHGIGGNSDSFGFFDQEHTGEISAELHLEKLTRRNNGSAGGLMIRASRDENAAHVSLLVTAKDGITMFVRPEAGAETTTKCVGVWKEDIELRLHKAGDNVTCQYKHASATEWYTIGVGIATFNTTYHVGQAVSSADFGYHSRLTTGVLTVNKTPCNGPFSLGVVQC